MNAKTSIIFLLVLVAVEISSVHGGCWRGKGCLGDDGIEHNDGDSWVTASCRGCSCSVSKRVLKVCKSAKYARRGKIIVVKPKHVDAVKRNKKFRCRVVSSPENYPQSLIVHFVEEIKENSCCSKIMKYFVSSPNCAVKHNYEECTSKIINIETGGPCTEGSISAIG